MDNPRPNFFMISPGFKSPFQGIFGVVFTPIPTFSNIGAMHKGRRDAGGTFLIKGLPKKKARGIAPSLILRHTPQPLAPQLDAGVSEAASCGCDTWKLNKFKCHSTAGCRSIEGRVNSYSTNRLAAGAYHIVSCWLLMAPPEIELI